MLNTEVPAHLFKQYLLRNKSFFSPYLSRTKSEFYMSYFDKKYFLKINQDCSYEIWNPPIIETRYFLYCTDWAFFHFISTYKIWMFAIRRKRKEIIHFYIHTWEDIALSNK